MCFPYSGSVASGEEIKKTELKVRKLNLDQCKLSYGKNVKFLWIRVALVEKLLAKILASLVEHAEYVCCSLFVFLILINVSL